MRISPRWRSARLRPRAWRAAIAALALGAFLAPAARGEGHPIQRDRRHADETFERHRVLVEFTPQIVQSASSRLKNGERIEAQLRRSRPLSDVAGTIGTRRLTRAFRHRPSRTASPHATHWRARRANHFLLEFDEARSAEEVVALLEAQPGVARAQLNFIYTPDLVPNDRHYWNQWAHGVTGAELGWDIETGSSSVAIAVIGTGIDLQHPDLAANIWENTGEIDGNAIDDDANGFVDDRFGWDFLGDDNDPNPDSFDPSSGDAHETQVAGIAAAVGNNNEGIAGVSWGSTLMAVRADYTTADIAAAIDYAADNGAKVINLSFGNYAGAKYGPDTIVENAVDAAFAGGALLVSTAGNDEIGVERYPAALSNVIAVAATQYQDKRADFSNHGLWVNVAAPGHNMFTTIVGGSYDSRHGTSYAAPYISGLAALLFSADPSLSPGSVRRRIEYSADPVGTDYFVGLGRVNLESALVLSSDPTVFAGIRVPRDNAVVFQSLDIVGSVLGATYLLEYRAEGDPTWLPISSGGELLDDVLGTLDATSLVYGIYELRLTASGAEGEEKVHELAISVTNVMEGWPRHAEGTVTPAVVFADLAGDAASEVLASASAWHADGSSVAGWPVSIGCGDLEAPSVGDIDGDGDMEVVQASWGGDVCAWHHDGTPVAGWPVTAADRIPGSAALADLDGDGALDVVVSGYMDCFNCGYRARYQAYRYDGSELPGWPIISPDIRGYTPSVADLDGDGDLEVIFGDQAYHGDASSVAGWPSGKPGQVLSTDINDDGDDELFVIFNGVTLLDGDASVMVETALPGSYNHSAVGDLNHDGQLEICLGGPDGNVYIVRQSGGVRTGWPKSAGDAVSGCILTNVDSDPDHEVVVSTEAGLLHAWNLDATAVGNPWPIAAGNTLYGSPAATDLNDDGLTDILAYDSDGLVYVFQLGVPHQNPEFPMFHANAQHDGRYVPEPAIATQLVAGLALLWGIARRRAA